MREITCQGVTFYFTTSRSGHISISTDGYIPGSEPMFAKLEDFLRANQTEDDREMDRINRNPPRFL